MYELPFPAIYWMSARVLGRALAAIAHTSCGRTVVTGFVYSDRHRGSDSTRAVAYGQRISRLYESLRWIRGCGLPTSSYGSEWDCAKANISNYQACLSPCRSSTKDAMRATGAALRQATLASVDGELSGREHIPQNVMIISPRSSERLAAMPTRRPVETGSVMPDCVDVGLMNSCQSLNSSRIVGSQPDACSSFLRVDVNFFRSSAGYMAASEETFSYSSSESVSTSRAQCQQYSVVSRVRDWKSSHATVFINSGLPRTHQSVW